MVVFAADNASEPAVDVQPGVLAVAFALRMDPRLRLAVWVSGWDRVA